MIGPDFRNSDNARGIRNNNPFNLVQTSINWQGKVYPEDPRFETFANIAFGIRAGLLDLYNDWSRKGLKSISALITEFAPPFENDTAGYIRFVERSTGIPKNAPLQLPDLIKVAQAIIILENGQNAAARSVAAMVPNVAAQIDQFGAAAAPGPNLALLGGLALILSGL